MLKVMSFLDYKTQLTVRETNFRFCLLMDEIPFLRLNINENEKKTIEQLERCNPEFPLFCAEAKIFHLTDTYSGRLDFSKTRTLELLGTIQGQFLSTHSRFWNLKSLIIGSKSLVTNDLTTIGPIRMLRLKDLKVTLTYGYDEDTNPFQRVLNLHSLFTNLSVSGLESIQLEIEAKNTAQSVSWYYEHASAWTIEWEVALARFIADQLKTLKKVEVDMMMLVNGDLGRIPALPGELTTLSLDFWNLARIRVDFPFWAQLAKAQNNQCLTKLELSDVPGLTWNDFVQLVHLNDYTLTSIQFTKTVISLAVDHVSDFPLNVFQNCTNLERLVIEIRNGAGLHGAYKTRFTEFDSFPKFLMELSLTMDGNRELPGLEDFAKFLKLEFLERILISDLHAPLGPKMGIEHLLILLRLRRVAYIDLQGYRDTDRERKRLAEMQELFMKAYGHEVIQRYGEILSVVPY